MEAFFVSVGVGTLGELGDKTQLLAILLGVKFRRPLQIIAGILVATLLNHTAAGALGDWLAQTLGADLLRWLIGLSFLGMAVTMLLPGHLAPEEEQLSFSDFGVFGTTVVAFFIAEMGDKSQIATIALTARYADVVSVVAGTTAGMLIADAPAVLLGERIAKKVSMTWLRGLAAGVFAVLGALVVGSGGHYL